MDVLDHPLDAAAVNYLSFGFITVVNNLWTWVAFLTAAISFWKIRVRVRVRACGSASLVSNPSDHLSSSVSQSLIEDEVVDEQRKPVPQYAVSSDRQVVGNDCVTKGKLTVYYYEENPNDLMMTEEDKQMEEQVDVNWVDPFPLWQSWERMLKLKIGDSSWYRYQDLTVFNGNVVRLWDCCFSGWGDDAALSGKLI